MADGVERERRPFRSAAGEGAALCSKRARVVGSGHFLFHHFLAVRDVGADGKGVHAYGLEVLAVEGVWGLSSLGIAAGVEHQEQIDAEAGDDGIKEVLGRHLEADKAGDELLGCGEQWVAQQDEENADDDPQRER